MSNRDVSITNSQVIPVIESNLFQENPAARFAVGILAVGDKVMPGLENEYQGYFELRRKVYVDQTGQLQASELHDDGTDRDIDDGRSVAFGIVENRKTDQRVVAATRLIIKGFADDAEDNRPLPVEEFCPEVFEDREVPLKGIEVSRLISRHEKAAVQGILQWRIYAAALGYIANRDLGPTYGVIEPWLERHLNSTIPISRIGEPRYVPHYLDDNLPIEVHTGQFVDQMKVSHPGIIEEMQESEGSMTYFGKLPNMQFVPALETMPSDFVERRHRTVPVPFERRHHLTNAA